MGDQYILMGPYKEDCARTEVEELEFPSQSPLNKAVHILRDQGFKVLNFFNIKIHLRILILFVKSIFDSSK